MMEALLSNRLGLAPTLEITSLSVEEHTCLAATVFWGKEDCCRFLINDGRSHVLFHDRHGANLLHISGIGGSAECTAAALDLARSLPGAHRPLAGSLSPGAAEEIQLDERVSLELERGRRRDGHDDGGGR